MKLYLYIIGLLAVLTLGTSCTKFLEVKPTNRHTVSSYEDVHRLMAAHLRGYDRDNNRLGGTKTIYDNNDEFLLAHLYSDDYDSERYLNNPFARNNIGAFTKCLNWAYRDASESIWAHHFRNIGFYNMVLAELEKNASPDMAKNEIVDAEARVLRAWSFFRLMLFYAPYKQAALGLPLNTDPNAIGSYTPERPNQQENYKFITDNLERVLTYKTKAREGYNIFFDAKIINALLAQVYLFKAGSAVGVEADYHKAIQHAQRVLDLGLNPDIGIKLPQAHHSPDYYGIHKDLDYVALCFVRNTNEDYKTAVTGNLWYQAPQYPSAELLRLFDDSDKRRDAFFDKTEGYIIKYETDFNYGFDQYDFFRGSEMLLIVAESWAKLGEEAKALEALQRFTAPRYTTYTQPTGISLEEAIQIERRKEFCFDYTMRWYDLVRLQKGFSRSYTSSGVKNTYTLQDGDYRFCLPIPQNAEISQGGTVQNPGWDVAPKKK